MFNLILSLQNASSYHTHTHRVEIKVAATMGGGSNSVHVVSSMVCVSFTEKQRKGMSKYLRNLLQALSKELHVIAIKKS